MHSHWNESPWNLKSLDSSLVPQAPPSFAVRIASDGLKLGVNLGTKYSFNTQPPV